MNCVSKLWVEVGEPDYANEGLINHLLSFRNSAVLRSTYHLTSLGQHVRFGHVSCNDDVNTMKETRKGSIQVTKRLTYIGQHFHFQVALKTVVRTACFNCE